MIGLKFGKLTVTESAGVSAHKERLWFCSCDCGGRKTYTTGTLNRGKAKSCGCSRPIKFKHGLSGTRTYKTWEKMIERCHREGSTNFHKYGARGIFVCDKWRYSYPSFLADMGESPDGKTIDRIDGTKGYSPDNCRWASSREQARNKSNNRWVCVYGKRMIATDAAEYLGINFRTVVKRCVDGVYRE